MANNSADKDVGVLSEKEEEFNIDDLEDAEKNKQSKVIPVDHIKNGINQTSEILSWGFNSLKAKAVQANEELQKSEKFQHFKSQLKPTVDSINESYNENVRPKLSEGYNFIKEKTSEVYQSNKPTIDDAYEKSKQGLNSLNHGFNEKVKPKLNEGIEIIQEKSHEVYEKSKPALNHAKEEVTKVYNQAKNIVKTKPKDTPPQA